MAAMIKPECLKPDMDMDMSKMPEMPNMEEMMNVSI
jgi:hypothetical protein